MANQEIIGVQNQYEANREINAKAEQGYRVAQIASCYGGGSFERLWILFEKVEDSKYRTIE